MIFRNFDEKLANFIAIFIFLLHSLGGCIAKDRICDIKKHCADGSGMY